MKPSGGKFTFTTQCVVTEVRGGLSEPLLTVLTTKPRQYFNTTAATGTGAENVSHTIATKLLPITTKHAKTGS